MSERTKITVKDFYGEYVAEWDGREVRCRNPFGLDSRLSDIGAPNPRDLCLIEIDGVPNKCCNYHEDLKE
jgi:hypothetical protein